MTATAKKRRNPDFGARDLRRLSPESQPPQCVDSGTIQSTSDVLDVTVDGESVTIQARQRVEIKCGQARIVLRADGAVFINGVDITTRAKKRQRISGGTVSIN